ncbi:DUF397 domain-containing protein [Catenuloplanes indicus]|uniref:DUF397 domain-containing protein n=1 Tax=Catenuloplanes indicus TaxID=137267 RepID=A0AAE4B3B2_9ACTN|nr:hypothetical protein [Catenuloplanes indicus]
MTAWRKSSRCESHTCVEIATLPGIVLVRDSKDPDGEVLAFEAPAWRAFLAAVHRAGVDPIERAVADWQDHLPGISP